MYLFEATVYDEVLLQDLLMLPLLIADLKAIRYFRTSGLSDFTDCKKCIWLKRPRS